MYQVRLSRKAEKSLADLPERDARRVAAVLQLLRMEPRQPGTIKLATTAVARYRHRVGEYRILFDIDDDDKLVRVLEILRRSERTYR